MRYPLHEFSPVELCVTATYVYCGFFAVTVAAEVFAADTHGQTFCVVLAGLLSWAILLRSWLQQQFTRGHIINAILLVVGGLIALDIAAALIP